MNIIDELQIALGDYFNKTTKQVNYVKIFDTPKVWGEHFGKGIIEKAISRESEFETAITEIINNMQYRCDISSLNAPDKEWREVILATIDDALTQKKNREIKTQIRFLFAQTPTVLLNGVNAYFEGTPEYLALKEDIIKLVQERSSHWEVIPEIWIGRFYRIVDSLKVSLGKKILPDNLMHTADTRMTWNHTKIIAVDGLEAFVGGHNLNMDLFKSYPPVHDVSVKVIGDAALAAQQFLNNMWQAGTDLLTKEYFDEESKKWVSADGGNRRMEDPLDKAECIEYMLNKQIDAAQLQEDGYKKASRILSVGKYWTGPDMKKDYQKGSEIMKEFVIKNAKKKIRMSQQDLISAWKKDWKEHHVCRWLIEALLANPKLEVQIVVSPLDAAAGATGDQYSFGSGAKRTLEIFKYFLTHDAETDVILPDTDGSRLNALKRIKIAPFFFTDDMPANCDEEGKTYKWPDVSSEAYTATLKEPPLSERPPRKGKIGRPFISLIKGSGFIYPKVPPAPANHAKVTIIDDEVYIVGSDNMYPGYLSEFNYIIEGSDAVTDFVKSYWKHLWHYSSRHLVNYKSIK